MPEAGGGANRATEDYRWNAKLDGSGAELLEITLGAVGGVGLHAISHKGSSIERIASYYWALRRTSPLSTEPFGGDSTHPQIGRSYLSGQMFRLLLLLAQPRENRPAAWAFRTQKESTSRLVARIRSDVLSFVIE